MASSVRSGRTPASRRPLAASAAPVQRRRRARRGRWPSPGRGLPREVAEERQARLRVLRAPARRRRRRARARAGRRRARASPCTESTACAFMLAGRLARRASRAGRCGRGRARGCERRYARNGSSARASGHRMPAEVGEHAAGDEHRHEGRRDRVGEEVLDQLDVVGGHADQIAASAGASGRRAPRRSSFRNRSCACGSSRRKAMSWASHDSSQCRSPASGATTASATSRLRTARPRLHRQHDQRAQHAHADERGHAGHARARR